MNKRSHQATLWALMASALAAALSFGAPALAQTDLNTTAELNIEPPAKFDIGQAVAFEVSPRSRLSYALIPNTLSIGSDGIVRYVMVVTSPTGAQNVLFDAVRCASDDSKTLARWSNTQKHWFANENSSWADVNDLKHRYSQVLARGIFCENHVTRRTVDEMLGELNRRKGAGFY